MKRIFALLLALAMMLTLIACGTSTETPTAEEAAEAPAADAAAETAEEAGSEYPTMTLNVSCSYNEAETSGQQLAYFTNYITEKSGGNITFNVYWGATFCTAAEDLEYVSNGSVDMTLLSNAQYASVLPLTNFPTMAGGSQENVVDMVQYIMFENDETAALIEQELTDNNVKVLNVNAGGTNAIVSKSPLSSYEDCQGMILGAMMNQSTYEDLGMTFKFSVPPETYSDLQKGVVDCAGLSLAGVVGLAWYEVAPYVITDGMYSCSNYYTINLDKWNSFDEATQALFMEAGEAACENSFVLNEGEFEACVATINDYNAAQGIDATVGAQDEEHAQIHVETYMKNAFADCRTTAANAGKTDEMEIILAAVADYLGLEA